MGNQPAVLLIGLKFKWTLEAFGVEVVFTYVRQAGDGKIA